MARNALIACSALFALALVACSALPACSARNAVTITGQTYPEREDSAPVAVALEGAPRPELEATIGYYNAQVYPGSTWRTPPLTVAIERGQDAARAVGGDVIVLLGQAAIQDHVNTPGGGLNSTQDGTEYRWLIGRLRAPAAATTSAASTTATAVAPAR